MPRVRIQGVLVNSTTVKSKTRRGGRDRFKSNPSDKEVGSISSPLKLLQTYDCYCRAAKCPAFCGTIPHLSALSRRPSFVAKIPHSENF